MPKLKNREYRNMSLLMVKSDKKIESDHYVEGYATTFEVPYLLYEWEGIKYYEVIDRHALDDADVSDVIFQYDHSGKVFARNSNKSLILESDNHGLLVCADLGKTSSSRSMFEDIDAGLVTKMSWSFTVAEESYDREKRIRRILRIKKVYDVSAVSYPANADTEIYARSFIDGVIEREKQELLERKRQLELAKAKALAL